MSKLEDMFKEFAKNSIPKKPLKPPKKITKKDIEDGLKEEYKGVDFERIKNSVYFQRLVTYILKVAFDDSFKDVNMKESKEVMKKKLDRNVDKINICQSILHKEMESNPALMKLIVELKTSPMFLKHRID